MARGVVYLDFYGELYDLFAIKSIRRFESFSSEEGEMEYGIIINEEVHTDSPFRDIKIKFQTEEVREARLKEIKEKLLGFEYAIII